VCLGVVLSVDLCMWKNGQSEMLCIYVHLSWFMVVGMLQVSLLWVCSYPWSMSGYIRSAVGATGHDLDIYYLGRVMYRATVCQV
jgi:hypothetical protein